ncbi:exodeoxyribonuclease VII large subunit, partial [Xinfangfangia pollutisoli]|uniref:exodeoxyribonuclease VII large subunit n=1 Tax=Xinfangfangia pollutisoli TaxID=2865960 RepID=UPI00296EB2C1
GRGTLDRLAERLEAAPAQRLADLSRRLEALDRMRQSLGPDETLKRGFAVVRGDGQVVTGKAAAERAQVIELQFHDGRVTLPGRGAAPKRPGRAGGAEGGEGGQGSLF